MADKKAGKGKILGIDLGTTNSCMAVMEAGTANVIPNAEGARTTPSVVAFTKSGERLVGQAAKRQAITNPKNTVFSVKRLIGRKRPEVEREAKSLPYGVVAGRNGDAWVEVQVGSETKRFSPEEISSMILAKLKADAEKFLGETITQAVITVPAYFNDSQRQATKDAGQIAGLEVLRIINEPTAASLAYGLDRKKEEKIAVYDLGGGTYDISVLDIGDEVFEVRATNGDTHLGGDDWDEAIIQWLVDNFRAENGIDLRGDPMALQRLKEEAEKAKITLSTSQETDINLPFITADATGPRHVAVRLTRAQLEKICEPLVRRTVAPFEACLRDAKLGAGDINELVLVGGMTRNPQVIETARKLTGKTPNQGVNPDEVVAIGAAIQGGVLQGEVGDILLLDVTPLTLGIETAGSISTPMIERNTTIPAKKTQIFTTYADGQTGVDIHILQGERPMACDNKSLGNFRLDGLPMASRGVPQIEVTFDIDANGILHVSAKDKGTGKEQKITITSESGLSDAEIERLKKEAETHAEEDKGRRDRAEARNQLDSIVYQVGKQLEELKDKFSQEDRENIQGTLDAAQKILEKSEADADEMNAAREAVSKAIQSASQKMYAQSQPDGGTNGGGCGNCGAAGGPPPTGTGFAAGSQGQPADGKVVDADFEVVDGNRK
ncbi:MAG: molecular chaperone DnaK [Puniceicoccales bacterium]|jgi:molecular chaperone DnaK|nr:molecular chaperone DnaK [Puniceicoccales bacterium]